MSTYVPNAAELSRPMVYHSSSPLGGGHYGRSSSSGGRRDKRSEAVQQNLLEPGLAGSGKRRSASAQSSNVALWDHDGITSFSRRGERKRDAAVSPSKKRKAVAPLNVSLDHSMQLRQDAVEPKRSARGRSPQQLQRRSGSHAATIRAAAAAEAEEDRKILQDLDVSMARVGGEGGMRLGAPASVVADSGVLNMTEQKQSYNKRRLFNSLKPRIDAAALLAPVEPPIQRRASGARPPPAYIITSLGTEEDKELIRREEFNIFRTGRRTGSPSVRINSCLSSGTLIPTNVPTHQHDQNAFIRQRRPSAPASRSGSVVAAASDGAGVDGDGAATPTLRSPTNDIFSAAGRFGRQKTARKYWGHFGSGVAQLGGVVTSTSSTTDGPIRGPRYTGATVRSVSAPISGGVSTTSDHVDSAHVYFNGHITGQRKHFPGTSNARTTQERCAFTGKHLRPIYQSGTRDRQGGSSLTEGSLLPPAPRSVSARGRPPAMKQLQRYIPARRRIPQPEHTDCWADWRSSSSGSGGVDQYTADPFFRCRGGVGNADRCTFCHETGNSHNNNHNRVSQPAPHIFGGVVKHEERSLCRRRHIAPKDNLIKGTASVDATKSSTRSASYSIYDKKLSVNRSSTPKPRSGLGRPADFLSFMSQQEMTQQCSAARERSQSSTYRTGRSNRGSLGSNLLTWG